VIAAWSKSDEEKVGRQLPFSPDEPYAVLHAYPKFNYKMWRQEAWVEIAQWLKSRGLRVVLSGSGDAAELAYVDAIARAVPNAVNLAGKLTLSQLAYVLNRARAYAGPDTAVTHMAAALGVPVVALYGATDPVKWGPWPKDYARAANPWRRLGTQKVNNVTLIQGSAACAPCFNEGCDRNVASYSDCLQQLPVSTVTSALANALDAVRHG
jgi:heptosyltransferase-3